MMDTKPAVFIRLNSASKINHRTHNPSAFKLYVSVLPENKGTLSQLKGTDNLTSEVTWSFRFENPEKSNILFELHEFIPQDEKVGRLVLPLKWFRPNTVCRETYPMKPTNKAQEPMLIDLTIHFSNNGDGPFQAPEGTLTVTPAWKKQKTPVVSTSPQISSPQIQPTIVSNVQPASDPYQTSAPTDEKPITLATAVPAAPIHHAVQQRTPNQPQTQKVAPNPAPANQVPYQAPFYGPQPIVLPYPPLPGIPPILGFVPGFQMPPPPQPMVMPPFVPVPRMQYGPPMAMPQQVIQQQQQQQIMQQQQRTLPRGVLSVQSQPQPQHHIAVEAYSQPQPPAPKPAPKLAPRAKEGAEEIDAGGRQLELDDFESPIGAVGVDAPGEMAPLEVGDTAKRAAPDKSMREKLLE